MMWKPYPNDRLIFDHGSFVVIKPTDSEQPISMLCPICDCLLKSREDEEAAIEFSCCHLCALAWAHPRRNEWKAGWRPTATQVSETIAMRSPSKLRLVTD